MKLVSDQSILYKVHSFIPPAPNSCCQKEQSGWMIPHSLLALCSSGMFFSLLCFIAHGFPRQFLLVVQHFEDALILVDH